MNKDKVSHLSFNEAEYNEILYQAISQIQAARIHIARQVNSSRQAVYWNSGKLLSEKQLEEGYGSGVVKQLAVDLKNEFPDMGLSPRNLWNMKRFYERYYQADQNCDKPSQFCRLAYNGKEYFVDMLFFHRGLRSLVAIELKIGSFKAEYVGKMNLYLSLLDRLEKSENENPSIGIILCADKDHLDVEIALQDINKPIGVAEYQLLLPQAELQRLVLNELNA
ncbi:PDDEXK nuclease domain-containing protein [Dyadobacter sp.]|uniref:PDDEXK nuclease domain-containing protein n=1 Tax=Dyadobacter sp. TaxID=1914288 RepID=UPI003F71D057